MKKHLESIFDTNKCDTIFAPCDTYLWHIPGVIVAVRGIPVVNKPVDVHERAPVGSVPNLQRQEDDSVATHVAYQELLDIDQVNVNQDQDGAFLASIFDINT